MLRTIGGVLAASLAAPYLASFFIFYLMVLFGASSGADIVFGAPSLFDEFTDSLKFLVIGTLGLTVFGLPVLFAAGALAFLLNALALHAKHHAVLGGAILGGLSLTLLFGAEPDDLRVFPLAGLLSGAICGWSYWRIALRPRLNEGIFR